MAKHAKDTEYLFLSSYLRAMETRMLTHERLERMLEARSHEDAAKVLSECGYQGLEPITLDTLDASIRENRRELYAELEELSPEPRILDVFRCRYDYHNAKALVKCAATDQDPTRLLIDAGRFPALQEAFEKDELEALPQPLQEGIVQARETLAATGDPQRADMILDRACFRELKTLAEETGSEFVRGYVSLMADVANLRTAVRCMRLDGGQELLTRALVEGGSADLQEIIGAALTWSSMETVFPDRLQTAVQLGQEAAGGGAQTWFERACDNALVAYLQEARMVPFGDCVLAAYVAARENDLTAARIVMSGRLAGVPTDSIRERLREAYV